MSERPSVSFERPLADGDKLVVTIELDGEATIQPPSGWTLSVDDLIETRHGGERMLTSPKEFKWLLDGRKKTPRWRKVLRWLRR